VIWTPSVSVTADSSRSQEHAAARAARRDPDANRSPA
jgi:hypothetical protein